LAQITVLMQSILCLAGFVEGEAEVDVGDHDLFVRWRPCSITAEGEYFVECGERQVVLVDAGELHGATECILGFLSVVGHFD